MTKLYLFAKKIHRIMVLFLIAFILFMSVTGTMLKYSGFSTKYLGFLDLGAMRYLHGNLSPFFAIALTLMALTGLYMYIYPELQKRKNVPKTTQQKTTSTSPAHEQQ